jgi:lipopolysaccharide export system protein LptA
LIAFGATLLAVSISAAVWAGTSVGVAPFERQGPPGVRVVDVAPRLAQRLGTAGLDRVVGPSELGARRTAAPTPEEVEQWGADANVESVLVGRVTRFGTSLSVDARLYDSLTGLRVGEPIVAEVADPEDLPRALDDVARGVAGQLHGDRKTTVAPEENEAPRSKTASRPDEPIEITSDGLSFEPSPSGGRQMDFNGNVKIIKGPLVVTSRSARAIYPAGDGAPDEIVARGNVVIKQEGRVAHCQQADFDQARNVMVCTGAPATLEQSCDRVKGKKITFSLDTEELNVEGNVEVKRVPGCEAPA